MEETIAALQTLYVGTQEERPQANLWLQEFVRRVESWTICDQLLRHPSVPNEVYYFAAQTLHAKVVSSLDDLPHDARRALRQSLLEHLDRFKAGLQLITVQLSLALAALATQMEDWANPVQDVTVTFGANPATLSLLLEFLTVLPDECDNPRVPVTRDRRAHFRHILFSAAPTIVAGLLQYSQSAPADDALQKRVFACLLAWIKAEAIPVEVVAASGFVPLLFGSLARDALFDMAVDSLCEVIHQTADLKHAALVADLLARLPPLASVYREAVKSDSADVARGIARLFVHAGEAYIFAIIAEFEVYGILTELILECTAHPDLELAQISFNFWFQLAEELQSADTRGAAPKFFSAYSRLMGVIIDHLKYPDEATQTWTAEQRDDFRDFRHVVGDTLKDCCSVLGGQRALQLVYDYLVAQLSTPLATVRWQSVEAGLFAIRSMASGVDMSDNVVLPRIMELVLSNNVPSHPKIRYTVTLIIGRYSAWSRNNPGVLQAQIQYIVGGFADEEVCAASALALKHLTKACDNLLAGSLNSLLEFHSTAANKMKLDDILEITEAIANLISALPPDRLSAALGAFWGPVMTSLNQLSLAPADSQSVIVPQLLLLLDRLTIFVKHLDLNIGEYVHPLVPIFSEGWPVFERIFEKYGDNPDIAEKACRCMKYTVKSCKLHFRPLLETLIGRLVGNFRRSLQSSYLYAAKEIVDQFGRSPEDRGMMISMLSEMSAVTFGLLQRHDNFVQHPDVVEDYFMFFKEYLENCPRDVVPFLDPVFQCGLAGLTFNHRDAIVAVIVFFERLLVISRRKDNETLMFPVVRGLVGKFGFHLVQALLLGMAGIFPSSCIEDIAEIFRMLMEMAPVETQQWIEQSLPSLPGRVSAAEKQQFLHDVYHMYRGNGFAKMMKAFGSVLRQRK